MVSFKRPLCLLALGLTTAASNPMRGCGPDFPNAYLGNTLDDLTTLPALSFEQELLRQFPEAARATVPSDADRAAAERAEVRAVLRAARLPSSEIDQLAAAYERSSPPAALPEEFQLYARGARAWHAGDWASALATWRSLLALPAPRRHYRSVWAQFMIARTLADTDPVNAPAECERVRQLAAEGFADSQGLATTSLGWEARAALWRGEYAPRASTLRVAVPAPRPVGARVDPVAPVAGVSRRGANGRRR